jgi:membrane-associated phospholipid phosphatase
MVLDRKAEIHTNFDDRNQFDFKVNWTQYRMSHNSKTSADRWPNLFSGSVVGVGFIAAVSALLFFAWLAEEMLAGDTMLFDNIVRGFVHEHSCDTLTALMRAFTFAGSTLVISTLTGLVLAVFIFGRHWWSTVVFAVMMAGALLLNFVLKTSFARDRPTTYFDTPVPNSYSFPSGHALFSLCFYVSLAWILTRHMTGRLPKVGVWLFAVLLVCGVGLSRIYLGVHYPSDVIAGYATAVIWLSAVACADGWLSARSPLSKKRLPAKKGKGR